VDPFKARHQANGLLANREHHHCAASLQHRRVANELDQIVDALLGTYDERFPVQILAGPYWFVERRPQRSKRFDGPARFVKAPAFGKPAYGQQRLRIVTVRAQVRVIGKVTLEYVEGVVD